MKNASLCRAFAVLAMLAFAAISTPVFASGFADEAQFSKTYAFPISSLEKVEQAMQAAAARTGADKTVEAVYVIDANQNSTVHCAAGNPIVVDNSLYGCTMNFVVDLGSGATLTAREILFPTQTSQQANDLLSKADPNKTSRVDLHSPFDGGKGSAYYCNAEGAPGAKQWACYLTVID